jgi:hypothetical protein
MRYCFATTTPRIEEVHVPGDVDKLFMSDPKNVSLSAAELKPYQETGAVSAGTSASDGAIARIQRALGSA